MDLATWHSVWLRAHDQLTWQTKWGTGHLANMGATAELIIALLRHSLIVNTNSNVSLLLCSPLPSQLACSQTNTQLVTPSSLSFPLSATMDKHRILP